MDKDISQAGQYLKYEREKTDIKIEDISNQLKLPTSTIRALEEGDSSALPEIVYVKGYIRAYCGLIGIDAEPALKFFSDKEKTNKSIQDTQSLSPIVNEHTQHLTRVWGTVLVLAIIGFILISSWGDDETVSQSEEPSKMVNIDKMVNRDVKSQNPQTSELTDQTVSAYQLSEDEDLSAEIPPTSENQLADGEIQLTLVANAPSWARVYNAEGDIVRRILPAGYNKDFAIVLPIHVELGDARNIEVFLNKERYDIKSHISNLNTAFFVIKNLPTQ